METEIIRLSYKNRLEIAKNSNKKINNNEIDIAKPSIPSIKLIALMIETIINIVRICCYSIYLKTPNTP